MPDFRPYNDMWDRHETLKHVRDIAEARMVVPWALLGCTLARVISAIPYNIMLPPIIQSEASLNFFVAMTGPSGSGKSGAIGCSYSHIKVDGEAARENLGTGEGLAMVFLDLIPQGPGMPKILVRNNTMGVVYLVDEITALGELGSREGSTIQSTLRTAWSGGQIGQKNADPTRDRKVEANDYRLCLISGVQPRRSQVLFKEEGSGSPQRFVWFPTIDEHLEVDEDLLGQEVVINPLHIAMPNFPPLHIIRHVKVCSKAAREIQLANLHRQQNRTDALNGHLLLCQLKVATGLAVMCDKKLEVTEFWWEIAGIIMTVSNLTRMWAWGGAFEELRAMARQEGDAYGVREAQKDSAKMQEISERVGNIILKWLKDYPEGASKSTLYRHVAPADRKSLHTERIPDGDGNTITRTYSNFDLAWENLVEEGRITVTGRNRSKKPIWNFPEYAGNTPSEESTDG